MGTEFKTELKIPDLWYDFYARFLPGAAFVAALRLIIFKNDTLPATVMELFLLLFTGYFCALISQPLSSRLAIMINNFVEMIKKQNRGFVKLTQHIHGRESRDSMILSKMNAELTFFVQLSVLSAVTLVLQLFLKPHGCLGIFINLICIFIFIVEAVEVSFRRLSRALEIPTPKHNKIE